MTSIIWQYIEWPENNRDIFYFAHAYYGKHMAIYRE